MRLAASLLGLGAGPVSGGAWASADRAVWRAALRPLVDAGYRAVELPDAWLGEGDDPAASAPLLATLRDLDLEVAGVLVARRSVIEPGRGEEHLAATHRLIDLAATLGIPVVCTGLHGPLSPAADAATWFWSVPDPPADPALRPIAVARVRELAEHAAERGIRLSLETYERTFLGDADSAARFAEEVGHPACGINADLGNLLRAPEPVPAWEDALRPLLPHLDYWHVKNCQRAEDPARGIHLSWPVEHAAGLIDYRRAIALARAAGFDGTIVVEQYGGDAIGVIARAHDHLAGILAEA